MTSQSRETKEYLGYGRIKTTLPPGATPDQPRTLANFLGLFSLGLGLAEVIAPRTMARLTGVNKPALLRAYGMREIASGIGILQSERPAFWLWSRVAGDTLDLATIAASAVGASNGQSKRVMAAAAAVAGVTVLDVLCACEHSDQ
jgi:hypothetical protein